MSSGATTGAVVVSVGGVASNGLGFTVVLVPSITSLSATSGVPGAQITISGSAFGAVQGTGTVWLGSTPGPIVNWSNTQIVATVASNSMTGIAQVQQNGVFSNAQSFSVSTATISNVSPTSGAPGTQVTITGSGFGARQGASGQVWLGTLNGVVQNWSDTQVVATVAAGSTGGGARVLQNGVMSPASSFTVPTLTLTGIRPTLGSSLHDPLPADLLCGASVDVQQGV